MAASTDKGQHGQDQSGNHRPPSINRQSACGHWAEREREGERERELNLVCV